MIARFWNWLFAQDARSCTCYPDEAPWPCERKYAFTDCQAAHWKRVTMPATFAHVAETSRHHP